MPIARLIILTFIVFSLHPLLRGQDECAQHEHTNMSMMKSGPTPSELLSWKRESEGNHHLIGFLVALSGLFLLAGGVWKKRLRRTIYVWPICFLLSGFFVLVYSDTELWPFGPRSWIEGLSNPEVIQHKIFGVLLVGVGLIELARARERINAAWASWIFPLLAIAGSVLLLFHSHSAGMKGPNHMAVHARIQAEHLSYAVTGLGIGLANGLAGVRTRCQVLFSRLWPTLMIVLGILLMCYVE